MLPTTITEGRVCKGGQNPPNTSTERPPAPGGSGGTCNADSTNANVLKSLEICDDVRNRPPSANANREALRSLAIKLGRWPTAPEYADAGLNTEGGQCSCVKCGECVFSNDDPISNRNCYANLLRDRLFLIAEGFRP